MFMKILPGVLAQTMPELKSFRPFITQSTKYLIIQRVNPRVFDAEWFEQTVKNLSGDDDIAVFNYIDGLANGLQHRYYIGTISSSQKTQF